MGIYVPGITKPDHCCDCQFCEDSTSDCLLQNDAHWSTYSEQIKNCPLVEISEQHGDLIDRNALLDMVRDVNTDYFCEVLGVTAEDIDSAPAVIGAEGSEDE